MGLLLALVLLIGTLPIHGTFAELEGSDPGNTATAVTAEPAPADPTREGPSDPGTDEHLEGKELETATDTDPETPDPGATGPGEPNLEHGGMSPVVTDPGSTDTGATNPKSGDGGMDPGLTEQLDVDDQSTLLEEKAPDAEMETMAEDAPDPYANIAATIDVSESLNGDYSAVGYTITGVNQPYSYYKAHITNDGPLVSAYLGGGVTFNTNASGKTFRIIQSGVRGNPETKSGTAVITYFVINMDVNNITLILDGINIGVPGASTDNIGYILVSAGASATLLLGEDHSTSTSFGNFIGGSIFVQVAQGGHGTASLTIDSAIAPGSSAGTLEVTANTNDAAAIGGQSTAANLTTGSITINGGTIHAYQELAGATAAAIGGGGVTIVTGTGGTTAVAGSGNVVINGGTVNASTTGVGAAIGGGGMSLITGVTGGHAGAGSVTINGGTVTATATDRGAAIGGGGVIGYNSFAGAGNVTIYGGVVMAANKGYGAAIGGGSAMENTYATGSQGAQGGCTVKITGGSVTATANGGAGIGSGMQGFQGTSFGSRTINLGKDADVKAYSSGVDIPANLNAYPTAIYGATARPAIDASSLQGDGFFVNAKLNAVIPGGGATVLEVRKDGGGHIIDTLILPANYRCFAYSSESSESSESGGRADNIIAFNASDYNLLGGVVRNSDKAFTIFAIHTLDGYNKYGGANALLPVTLRTDSVPLTPRYKVYEGTPEPDDSNKKSSWYSLPSAVADCTEVNMPYTIVATEDDGNISGVPNAVIVIPANKIITLMSDENAPAGGWSLDRPGAIRHFNIQAGGTFTLENITLDGKETGGGLNVSGTVIMNDGAVIQNCMAGNITSGNRGYGGGVYLAAGSLTMNAGSVIRSNNAQSSDRDPGGGGGVYVDGGLLVMNPDSLITHNVAQSGNMVAGYGGGVYVNGANAKFDMNGGTINYNIAGTGRGYGGGVYVNGADATFDMKGGTVSDNIAALDGDGYGGGVSMESGGSLIMTGSAQIQNNTAGILGFGFGGGVSVMTDGGAGGTGDSVLVMSGAASINGNTASSAAYGYGGGVYIEGGSHTMSGGASLSGNTTGFGGVGDGGGVYVDSGSLTIEDAGGGAPQIVGNMAPFGSGGGVFTKEYEFINIGAGTLFMYNMAAAGFDLGLSQSDYAIRFSTILSPYGPYYSFPSNHPVNNYDINVMQWTVTVNYIDTAGAGLSAPPDVPETFKNYGVPKGFPFTLDTTDYKDIQFFEGYRFVDWAIGQASAREGNTTVSLPSVNEDMTIYLVYQQVSDTTVTISKTVKGDYVDRTRVFSFNVYFYSKQEGGSDGSGAPGDDQYVALNAGTVFNYTGGVIDDSNATAPAPGQLNLGADGGDTISLVHGQKIVIEGLPLGVYVRIVEDVPNDFTPNFHDNGGPNGIASPDTGTRFLGSLPRVFDFDNVWNYTIVPSGVNAGADTATLTMLLMITLLGAAIVLINRMRRKG